MQLEDRLLNEKGVIYRTRAVISSKGNVYIKTLVNQCYQVTTYVDEINHIQNCLQNPRLSRESAFLSGYISYLSLEVTSMSLRIGLTEHQIPLSLLFVRLRLHQWYISLRS